MINEIQSCEAVLSLPYGALESKWSGSLSQFCSSYPLPSLSLYSKMYAQICYEVSKKSSASNKDLLHVCI